jgi:DNA-binding transcriptional MerR regulator
MAGVGAGTDSGRTGTRRQTRSRTRSTDPPAKPPAQGELLPEGKLYYRIGEVSRITGVKPHVLRYWETEFRWMSPPKSRSKQRLYRRKDIEMVLAIKKLLYEERYTIAGARQQLRESGLARNIEGDGQTRPSESRQTAAESLPCAEIERLRDGFRSIRRELQVIRGLLS